MVKATKTQRLRERISTEVKHSKQTTLSKSIETYYAEPSKTISSSPKKQIEITEITSSIREDEMALKVAFKLLPSRTFFSKVTADLFFNEQKIDALHLRILQGPLAADDSEFTSVLDMTGVSQGQHKLRVEMYEIGNSGEKLTSTYKEDTIDYVPVKREDRIISVRIIKSMASEDLSVVSSVEESIYREINDEIRREAHSRRDKW
jgi:hypothetical protein